MYSSYNFTNLQRQNSSSGQKAFLSSVQPINKSEFLTIAGPASMHAIGHVAANLSFAAVAISLTHTVKTAEPVFSAILSYLILGIPTPLPVAATLIPIMVCIPLVPLGCCL